MSEAISSRKTRALVPVGTFQLWESGRRSVREVPKLRGFVWRGYILNYLIFFLISALLISGLYIYVIAPASEYLEGWSAGGGMLANMVAQAGKILVWVANLILMAGTLVMALVFSLSLMSVWFEALAGRIVSHWRGDEGSKGSLRAMVGSMGHSLKEGTKMMFLALLALFLGFIPVVGPVLVILVDSYLLGVQVRSPYLVVREEMGESPKDLRRGVIWWTFKAGWIPLVISAIPLLGLLILPHVMITLVAGTTWEGEKARKEAGGN